MNRIKINKDLLKSIIHRQDKRIFIYLVCVGIASLFWLLNALSKNYTVDLDFPVKYTNLPGNKILINEPPRDFKLQVNAYGFTLLRHKLKLSFSPLVFNVNEYTNNKMETSSLTEYSIATGQYLNKIADQLSSELKVLKIKPDSISFSFDQIIQKKVKVNPNVKVELKRQYQLSGSIRTKPDSVIVSGPQSVLDTLMQISTKFQSFKSVSEAIRRNVSLVDIENVSVEKQRIVLIIPIEEYTESHKQIPVTIAGKPDSINVKLFPNRVSVSYLVGLSRYYEILDADFDLVVAWEDIVAGHSRLKVKTNVVPPFIKSVKIVPEELEYLIEKR